MSAAGPGSGAGLRQRICIDMDEVIADAVGEHLRRYNQEFGAHVTVADIEGRWLWDLVPEERHPRLEAYLRSDDFFSALPVMPNAPRVIEALQERFEVYIATAAMEVPSSFTPKYEWLGRHFPSIAPAQIVFCGNKSILHADFLIDDNPRQLRRFRGQGILFGAHHNIHETAYPRVKDWLEVERMFLGG